MIVGAVLVAWGLSAHAQRPSTSQASPTPPPSPSPSQGQAAEQPLFRAGVNFVRVDVIASDRDGRVITDLTAADFDVFEQDMPQTIEMFKQFSLDGGLMAPATDRPKPILRDIDEEDEAARDDVRLFAIFLDDYHVEWASALRMRQQLARFVDTQLGPSDMIGLMFPSQPIAAVRMARNHRAVAAALNAFEGRKYNYTPRNEAEERYAFCPPVVVETIRNQVSLSALQSLIVRLGSLKEGRKALILVSEGFTGMAPPQRGDAAVPSSGGSCGRGISTAGYDLDFDQRTVIDLANRNNVAIYAVDPRGLTMSRGDAIESLRMLSLDTDGRAIVNRNEVTIAMKQVVQDQSSYYLLGYNSTFAGADGKFHAIKVRVKRPGVQVRARRGYWAYGADADARAIAPGRELPKRYADAMASVRAPRSRVVRTWVGIGQRDRQPQVTLTWEPTPLLPGRPQRPDDAPARVSLMAQGADGVPYFIGRVAPVSPSIATSVGGMVAFDAAPGLMQLRVMIESQAGGALDTETLEVDVPDVANQRLGVGTPSLYRSRTLREFQQQKLAPLAMPTASREFSRTDRLFARVPVWSRSGPLPTVTARLLNRNAEPVSALVVVAVDGPDDVRDVDIPLAPLAAGDYFLEVTASGSGEPIGAVVGFRLTS